MQARGNTNVTVGADYTITVGGSTYSGSIETANLKADGQMDLVRSSVGDSITKTYYDVTEEKVTYKFVTTANPFVPPTKGSIATVALGTSGKANLYLTGSNWIVESYTLDDSNTTARRCDLELSRNANITS